MTNTQERNVLITGGCGYVGSILTPKVARKYKVTVLDSMLFGNHLKPMPNVTIVQGDIRDSKLLKSLMPQITDVIHLAAIANDPTSDLDPAVTQAVNYDAIKTLVELAKKSEVKRFISASSSSVYGVKEEENVTEDLSLEPLTLYAKLKGESEKIVLAASSKDFPTVSIRAATVCGPSPRMRFDVIVNILAKSAIIDGVITVNGGGQYRPNVHIDDITDLYTQLLDLPAEKINGKIYNFGSTNYTVKEIGYMVHEETGAKIKVDANTTDNRSYRVSSEKIKRELGIEPKKTIRQAIIDIKKAFADGMFPDPNASRYYNIKAMKEKIAG